MIGLYARRRVWEGFKEKQEGKRFIGTWIATGSKNVSRDPLHCSDFPPHFPSFRRFDFSLFSSGDPWLKRCIRYCSDGGKKNRIWWMVFGWWDRYVVVRVTKVFGWWESTESEFSAIGQPKYVKIPGEKLYVPLMQSSERKYSQGQNFRILSIWSEVPGWHSAECRVLPRHFETAPVVR